MRSFIAAAFLAVTLAMPCAAFAGDDLPVSSVAEIGDEARPILAWSAFCEDMPDKCQIDLTEPTEIALTPDKWALIQSVNSYVNGSIKATSDEDHWGIVDRWSIPIDGKGDCEDYQLQKREDLVRHGFPRRAMRMTVVINARGEGHAVLMLRTNRGDFILDNARDEVLPWDQAAGYIYLKRESQFRVGWDIIKRASPIVVAAK